MTTLAPSAGGGSAASNTCREQMTRTDTAATGSRRVRNTAPPRTASSAICPSTQTRPSRLIHPPTSSARCGPEPANQPTCPAALSSCLQLGDPALEHGQAHRRGRRGPARTPQARLHPARRRGCAAGRAAISPQTARRSWAAAARPGWPPGRAMLTGSGTAVGSGTLTGSGMAVGGKSPPPARNGRRLGSSDRLGSCDGSGGRGGAERGAVRLVAEQPNVAGLVEVPDALPLGRPGRRRGRGLRRGRLGRRSPGRSRLGRRFGGGRFGGGGFGGGGLGGGWRPRLSGGAPSRSRLGRAAPPRPSHRRCRPGRSRRRPRSAPTRAGPAPPASATAASVAAGSAAAGPAGVATVSAR